MWISRNDYDYYVVSCNWQSKYNSMVLENLKWKDKVSSLEKEIENLKKENQDLRVDLEILTKKKKTIPCYIYDDYDGYDY